MSEKCQKSVSFLISLQRHGEGKGLAQRRKGAERGNGSFDVICFVLWFGFMAVIREKERMFLWTEVKELRIGVLFEKKCGFGKSRFS
jgi:hypothetical protein